MNSKSFIGAVVLIILYLSGNAQVTFTPVNNGHSFKLITPAINQGPYGNIPFTRAFVETGDGGFHQFSTASNAVQQFIKPWYFSNSNPVQAVVQLNTYYDTTRIPPLSAAFSFTPPIDNSSTNFIPVRLPGSQSILLTPSADISNNGIQTIIPGDMITMAITYKAAQGAEFDFTTDRTIVAFYYNAPGVTNLFTPISGSTQFSFSGTPVNAIRVPFGESIVALSSIDPNIQTILSSYIGSYDQKLYFSTTTSISERNIFLSLLPNANPADYTKLKSSVRAVVIDYLSTDLSKNRVRVYDQSFAIDFKSRDPNFLTVSPLTFKNRSSAINKAVNYKVHFENVGPGTASKIVIEVDIPKGFRLPVGGEKIYDCIVGGKEVRMLYQAPGTVVVPSINDKVCIYSIDRAHNKFTFTISNADLKGSIESNRINDRGDITFQLRTQDAANAQFINMCMFSKVLITFDGNRPVGNYFTTRVGPNYTTPCRPDLSPVQPPPQ